MEWSPKPGTTCRCMSEEGGMVHVYTALGLVKPLYSALVLAKDTYRTLSPLFFFNHLEKWNMGLEKAEWHTFYSVAIWVFWYLSLPLICFSQGEEAGKVSIKICFHLYLHQFGRYSRWAVSHLEQEHEKNVSAFAADSPGLETLGLGRLVPLSRSMESVS